MTRERLDAIIRALLSLRENATDEQALQAADIYPEWKPDTEYTVDGLRYAYGGKLYKCVQAHTSQTGWEPPGVQALWTEVTKPGEIPVWRQPTGAQDAYMTGDKVWFPEKDTNVYVSTIDNNVWSPEAYPAGWRIE